MTNFNFFYLTALTLFVTVSILLGCFFNKLSRFSPAAAFIFLFMLTDASYAIYSQLYPHEFYSKITTFIDNTSSKGFVLVLDIASLICIFIGYIILNPKITKISYSERYIISTLRRLNYFSFIATIIGICLFGYFYIKNNGLENPSIFANLYRNSHFRGSGLYTFIIVNLLPLIIQLNLIFMLRINTRLIKYKFWHLLMLTIFITGTSLLGFRISWIYLAFPLLWIYIYSKKIKFNYIKIILFSIIFTTILVLYGSFRSVSEYNLRNVSYESDLVSTIIEPIIRTNSLDVVSQSIINGNDHDYFLKFIIQPFINFLPNSLWVGKFNNSFSETVAYDFFIWRDSSLGNVNEIKMSGISPTFIGFSYWQGGYFGIFLYSILIGCLLKFIVQNLKNYSQISVYKILYSLALSSFVLIQLSSPQDALNALVQNFSLIYLLYLLLNIRI